MAEAVPEDGPLQPRPRGMASLCAAREEGERRGPGAPCLLAPAAAAAPRPPQLQVAGSAPAPRSLKRRGFPWPVVMMVLVPVLTWCFLSAFLVRAASARGSSLTLFLFFWVFVSEPTCHTFQADLCHLFSLNFNWSWVYFSGQYSSHHSFGYKNPYLVSCKLFPSGLVLFILLG